MPRSILFISVLSAVLSCTPADPVDDPSAKQTAPSQSHLNQKFVAMLDETGVTFAALDHYLGTVYDRLPEGNAVLNQMISEIVVKQHAQRLGLVVDDKAVEAAMAEAEAEVRRQSEGKESLSDKLSADVEQEELRSGFHLMLLLEKVVRVEQSFAPETAVGADVMGAWLEEEVEKITPVAHPLTEPVAYAVLDTDITRQSMGRRLRAVLPRETVVGVTNEVLGIALVSKEAARRGITVTTEAATEEVLEREVRVRAHPATQGYTYGQVVELATHRTLEEVLQSKKFATEVLLRLITEQEWDESRAEEFYTENRGLFQGTSEELDYATHRLAVWKEIRQRTYQDLHQKVRIVRRQ